MLQPLKYLSKAEQKLIMPFSLRAKYHSDLKSLHAIFSDIKIKMLDNKIANITFVVTGSLQAYNDLAAEGPNLDDETPLFSGDTTTPEGRSQYLEYFRAWQSRNQQRIAAAKAKGTEEDQHWLTSLPTLYKGKPTPGDYKSNQTHIDELKELHGEDKVQVWNWDQCHTEIATSVLEQSCQELYESYQGSTKFCQSFSQDIHDVIDTITNKLLAETIEPSLRNDDYRQHIQMCCTAYVMEELTIMLAWHKQGLWHAMAYPFDASPLNGSLFQKLGAIAKDSGEKNNQPLTRKLERLSVVVDKQTHSKHAKLNSITLPTIQPLTVEETDMPAQSYLKKNKPTHSAEKEFSPETKPNSDTEDSPTVSQRSSESATTPEHAQEASVKHAALLRALTVAGESKDPAFAMSFLSQVTRAIELLDQSKPQPPVDSMPLAKSSGSMINSVGHTNAALALGHSTGLNGFPSDR